MLENISSNPNVAIIILNWNGWKDTIECLESLYQITYFNYEIIVVDNGSIDESIEKIGGYCKGKIKVESKFFKYNGNNKPIKIIEYTREESTNGGKESELENINSNKKLILIKNEKNYGFAEGNNIAIKYVIKFLKSEYILLLNNDTVVHKDFLIELIINGERDKKIGILGPKIYYYYKKNIIQTMGVIINFWTGLEKNIGNGKTDEYIDSKLSYNKIDYVYGACFLIKKDVINSIGLLDPKLFLYGEEVDWAFKARIKGYKSTCCLRAKIWHKSQASSSKNLKYLFYYPTRNRIIILRRYSTTYQFLFSIIFYTLFSIIVLMHNIDSKSNYIKYFFQGLKDGLFS